MSAPRSPTRPGVPATPRGSLRLPRDLGELATAHPLWTVEIEDPAEPCSRDLIAHHPPPVVQAGVVMHGERRNAIEGYDVESGERRWVHRFEAPVACSAGIHGTADSDVVVATGGGHLVALRVGDGSVLWRRAVEARTVRPWGDALIVVASGVRPEAAGPEASGGRLRLLELASGRVLHERALPGIELCSVVATADERASLDCVTRLLSVRRDGAVEELAIEGTTDLTTHRPGIDGGLLVIDRAPDRGTRAGLFDPSRGGFRWRRELGFDAAPRVVGDVVLAQSPERLFVLDAATGTPLRDEATPEWGHRMASLLAPDGHLAIVFQTYEMGWSYLASVPRDPAEPVDVRALPHPCAKAALAGDSLVCLQGDFEPRLTRVSLATVDPPRRPRVSLEDDVRAAARAIRDDPAPSLANDAAMELLSRLEPAPVAPLLEVIGDEVEASEARLLRLLVAAAHRGDREACVGLSDLRLAADASERVERLLALGERHCRGR